MVNGEDGIFAENYALKLGEGHPGFGGGVSGFDMESNVAEDHAKNIWVINSLYDYEGSFQNSAGNALNFQAPGVTVQTQNINAFNNWIIGGRSEGQHRYMSNGILVSAANNVTIKNNYIYKTGQDAIQWYGTPAATGTGSLVEDNWFDSTGNGEDGTVQLNNTSGITLNRNRVTVEPLPPFSVDHRFQNCDSTNNVLTNTTFNGVPILFTTQGCRLKVVWTNVINVQVDDNSLKKITGTNAWDAGAVSSLTFSGPGYVEFTAGNTGTSRMGGLGNGDSSQSYTDIEYAFYLEVGGNLYVYESGIPRGQFGTYTGTDLLKVAVEGGKVNYYRNNTVIYTNNVTPQYPLRVDTSLNTQNSSLNQLTNVIIRSNFFNL
jgi:hypothetical protein